MFNLTEAEQAFKTAIQYVKAGAAHLEAAANDLLTNPKIAQGEAAANAVLEQVSPAAAKSVEAGESLLAQACKAVIDAGAAADAGGVNITLNSQAVSDVKAIIAALPKSAAVAKATAPAVDTKPATA